MQASHPLYRSGIDDRDRMLLSLQAYGVLLYALSPLFLGERQVFLLRAKSSVTCRTEARKGTMYCNQSGDNIVFSTLFRCVSMTTLAVQNPAVQHSAWVGPVH